MIRAIATQLSVVALCAGCGAAGATARPPATPAATAPASGTPNAVLVLAAAPGPTTRRRVAALGLRVVVALPPQNAASVAGPGIERALAYYGDFEFARALEVLDGVDATLARTARDRDDVSAAVRARLLRAANELALQREPAAVEALRAAAVLLVPSDPEPAEASPEIRARLALLRSELATASPARVTVDARPAGARVRIDGVELDDPAQPTALLPGRHFVHVEKDGSEPRVATIDVEAGEQRRVELELVPVLADTARAQISALGAVALARLGLQERRALGHALVAGELWRVERRGAEMVASAIPLGPGTVRSASAAVHADDDEAVARAVAALASPPQSASTGSERGTDAADVDRTVSVFESPWLWIAVAAVVAATATTLILVATPPERRGVLSIE